jgi:hypothetical protein
MGPRHSQPAFPSLQWAVCGDVCDCDVVMLVLWIWVSQRVQVSTVHGGLWVAPLKLGLVAGGDAALVP